MGTKEPLTFEEHLKYAQDFKTIIGLYENLRRRMWKALPVTSKGVKRIEAMEKSLHRVRSALDTHFCENDYKWKGQYTGISPYYGDFKVI